MRQIYVPTVQGAKKMESKLLPSERIASSQTVPLCTDANFLREG